VPHDEGLPAYETRLAAYHEAFAAELRGMIAGLPIAAGDRVLEVACGDGFYSGLLARTSGRPARSRPWTSRRRT
jgi:protein-L-isoaspartate O-methyltransferase